MMIAGGGAICVPLVFVEIYLTTSGQIMYGWRTTWHNFLADRPV